LPIVACSAQGELARCLDLASKIGADGKWTEVDPSLKIAATMARS
jgi:hypothetical protein